MTMLNAPDEHQEIRDAIRSLCSEFPDEYFRKIDEHRGYPEEFVNALIGAGWLSAMIPEEYGGSGLGLTAASVIMEQIMNNTSRIRRTLIGGALSLLLAPLALPCHAADPIVIKFSHVHLEEWLTTFLMGAATLIIFVSVVHRYGSGLAIPGVQDWLLGLNLGWRCSSA